MDYAEASYFDGFAFQHIAAWMEQCRLTRIRKQMNIAVERRRGSRRLG